MFDTDTYGGWGDSKDWASGNDVSFDDAVDQMESAWNDWGDWDKPSYEMPDFSDSSWSLDDYSPGSSFTDIGSKFVDLQDYNNSWLKNVTDWGGIVGNYGSFLNPVVGGGVGFLSKLVDSANRAYYGVDDDYSGYARAAGGYLGGGGIGSMVAGNVAANATRELQNPGTGAEGFGKDMATGIAGLVGGEVAGPIGSKLFSGMTPKLLELAGSMYTQNQAAKALKQYERDTDVYGTAQNLYQTRAGNDVYKADLRQAQDNALAALAAQGKLGSGARATAAAKLAEESANRQYQTYVNQMANAKAQSAGHAFQRAIMNDINKQKQMESFLSLLS